MYAVMVRPDIGRRFIRCETFCDPDRSKLSKHRSGGGEWGSLGNEVRAKREAGESRRLRCEPLQVSDLNRSCAQSRFQVGAFALCDRHAPIGRRETGRRETERNNAAVTPCGTMRLPLAQ